MDVPDQFRLLFSEGSSEIEALLLQYSSKLPKKEAFQVSPTLYKKIERVNNQIKKHGLPPNLQLAYVHPNVQTGVFLKPDAKPIKSGTFIGIYTGRYELVPSDITTGTSYAYDVAQHLCLSPKQFAFATLQRRPYKKDEEYSIQTNALKTGNFTRYINHSSFAPNIEAVVSKLPSGRIEILLFALHAIMPGEQLLSNYGGQYWKALEVIPDDMEADTYLMNNHLQAKLANPMPSLSAPHRKFLMPLRNIVVHISLEKSCKALTAFLEKNTNVPKVSSEQKKEIDLWEEEVLEKGLPRKWKLKLVKGKCRLSLKPKEKSLPPDTFLGVLAGSFSLSPQGFLVAAKGNDRLYFDGTAEGNFLSYLPISDNGNVSLKLYFDEEEEMPLILAYTKKKITTKDTLSICPMEPIKKGM